MHRPNSSIATLRLDIENQCLWANNLRVLLTPKCFALLRCLYERRPNLVTKSQLLESVWPSTRVEEGQVKQFVAELRRVLKDDSSSPRYIETVHGRGYRFIGELALETTSPHEAPLNGSRPLSCHDGVQTSVVREPLGRSDRLEQLQCLAQHALEGQPTLACLTGESGIGKTTLANAFVRRICATHPFKLLHSQCIETFSHEENYAPILDAMGRMRTGLERDNLMLLLETHAPSWHERVSAATADGRPGLRSAWAGKVSASRLQREFSTLIQFLSEHQPLLLWLEDIHQCDPATLHLLRGLTRSPMLGRVLIIATCAPLDTIAPGAGKQALGQILCASRGVTEIPVCPLDRHAMESFLMQRWPDYSKRMIHWFAHYTQGNPALMTRVADQITLDSARILRCFHRPPAIGTDHFHDEHTHLANLLRHVGEKYVVGLTDPDRDFLEVASVAGLRFSTASLSRVIARPLDEVERQCERLCGSGLPLRREVTALMSESLHTASYVFSLRIYHRTLYESVPPIKRARIHQSMATHLERDHGASIDDTDSPHTDGT